MRQGVRTALVNCLVLAFTVVVFLAGAEIVLRSFPNMISVAVLERFHPEPRAAIAEQLGLTTKTDQRLISAEERSDGGPPLFVYKPDTTYRFPSDPADLEYGAADRFRTDHHGFCNEAGKADPGTLDVLSIGGSIPNCVAIPAEGIFTAMLERKIGKRVYNLGVGGVGPYEYLEVLRRFGLGFSPRVVIMHISEGNDLRDVIRFNSYREGGAKRRKKKQRMGGLFAVSHAAAFIKAGIELAVKRSKTMFGLNFRYSVSADGKTVAMNPTNNDRDEVKHAQMLRNGEIGPELYEPAIAAFAKLAGEAGFEPVVAYIPAAYTVYDSTIAYVDDGITDDMRHYSTAQRTWFRDNAARLNVKFIDTTPGLQAAAKSQPLLFFPANLHFTFEGHEALAAIIAPAVAPMTGTH